MRAATHLFLFLFPRKRPKPHSGSIITITFSKGYAARGSDVGPIVLSALAQIRTCWLDPLLLFSYRGACRADLVVASAKSGLSSRTKRSFWCWSRLGDSTLLVELIYIYTSHQGQSLLEISYSSKATLLQLLREDIKLRN